MRARAIFLLVVVLLLSAACGSSSKHVVPPTPTPGDKIVWPAPNDPMARATAAGLVPETAERLQYHVHAHLDVFINGKHTLVPGGIGIDGTNPAVHSGTVEGQPAYGGISVPCDKPCISPLHTHDATGVLHTESATRKNNTLGQFFVEWGVRLDTNCVATYCRPATPIAVYVDGKANTFDPGTIELSDRKEIAIVIGTPPAQIPSSSGL